MRPVHCFFIFVLSFLSVENSFAIEIGAKNAWNVQLIGTIESIVYFDSTKSFREVTANNPVARPGTSNGDQNRTQISMKTSRFGFLLNMPEQNAVKQQALVVFDFLGYSPNPTSFPPANSETSYFNSSTLRLILANYSIEKNGWRLIAGQAGSVFGWTPLYYPAQMGIVPISGVNTGRPPQISFFKSIATGEIEKLQSGLSFSRPAQSDSGMPNLDFGLRYTFGNRKAAYTNAANSIALEQANIAISGTLRKFEIANSPTDTTTKSDYGGAFALDMMIPIIYTKENHTSNTMVLLADFTTGKGYSEVFNGATFNLPQLPATSAGALAGKTNLDPGLGGFDTFGNFKLAELFSLSSQLQYHLPFENKSFVTAGYGYLKLKNPEGYIPITGQVIYDISRTFYTGFYYDFSELIRAGIEYRDITTEYVDGISANNDRFSFSTMFRF
jgi:hypothetical protein